MSIKTNKIHIDMQDFELKNIREYGSLLKDASISVQKFKGSESTQENVLEKLIKIEEFLTRFTKDFTSSQINDFEEMISLLSRPNRNITTRDTLLDKCIIRLAAVHASSLIDIEEVATSLNIELVKYNDVFVPPSPEKEINTSNRNGNSNFDVKYEPRVQWLITGLSELGVYTDDLIFHVGIVDPKQMRKTSYVLIEIPRMQSEILVCNQVGEATFVSNQVLGCETYIDLDKDDLALKPSIKKFVCLSKEDWLEEIQEHLKDNKVGEKIDVNDMQELREGIKLLIPNPRDWTIMGQIQKSKFKVSGLGLTALATKFNVKGHPIGTHLDHLELGAKIYGKEARGVKEALENARKIDKEQKELGEDLDKWRKRIKEDTSSTGWTKMSKSQKEKFKIEGLGLRALATKFKVKGNPLSIPLDYLELGAKIYGEDAQGIKEELENARKIDKEQKELGEDLDKWRKKIREEISSTGWAKMTHSKKKKLKLIGLGLATLATKFNAKGNPVGIRLDHLELGAKIFGEDAKGIKEKLEIAREQKELGEDLDKCRERIKEKITSPDWVNMTASQKKKFKIAGLGLTTLATKFNVKGNPVGIRLDHLELGAKIFGEDAKGIKEELENARKIDKEQKELGEDLDKWRKKIREEISSTGWTKMSRSQKEKLKMEGLGLRALAVKFRVNGNPVGRHLAHLKLGAEIYGEDAKGIKEALENSKKSGKS